MMYLFVFAGAVALIAAISAVSSVRGRRRLRVALTRGYGRPPHRRYDQYVMESIASLWQQRVAHDTPDGAVDDLTWQDLDMDSVYRRLNSCCSSVGEETLYATLRGQSVGQDALERMEQAASWFDGHPQSRLCAQVALSGMGLVTGNGVADFFRQPQSRVLRLHTLYWLLAAGAVVSLSSLFWLGSAGVLVLVLMGIINGVVYSRTKIYLDAELTSVHSISAMIVCAGRLSRQRWPGLESYTRRLGQLQAPLRGVSRMASSIMTKNNPNVDMLVEYVKAFFLLDFLAYNRMVAAITRHAQQCREMYDLLGFLDTAIAVASYRRSVATYSTPVFTAEDEIVVSGLVHPLLEHPVPSTVTLARSSLITGSNASGKSTFVKALALNVILAQTIHTCLAQQLRLRPSLVVTSMAVSDSLQAGESYYIAEIRSLRRIFDGLRREARCLCFIDEILKGTNTIERIAASAAVLDYLRAQNCLAVVATHDIELTEIAAGAFDNFHFQERIDDDGVKFDYRIREGRATTKNAVKLLEFMDYPAAVTEKANRMAERFERERVWEKI